MPDKVLVLYANFGSLGHTVVAQNYAALLARHGYAVKQIDVLEADPGPAVGFLARLYTFTLNRFPAVWRFLYAFWTRVPGMQALRTRWMVRRFRNTRRILEREQPEAVITTQPLATAIASRLKTSGRLRSSHFTVLGDWHMQAFWCFPGVDRYLANTGRQREELLALGVPAGQIVVAGHLVAEEYRGGPAEPEALGIPRDRSLLLAMGGGRGWGLEKTLQAIAALKTPVCAVFLCRGEARRAELERLWSRIGSGHAQVRLLAFVPDPSPYFHAADLVIAKPSGQGLAQAFACRRPVLAVSPEPGHEEANLRELRKDAAVLEPEPGERLSDAIDRLLAQPALLERAADQGSKLMSHDTGNIVIQLMERVCMLLCLLLPLCAQPPAIRTNGVVNAASQVPSALPGGAIARGSLFHIYGVGLGAASVRIGAVRVPVLAAAPGRIEARLPADAPLGDALLVVTAGAQSSPPFPLKIVAANFGVYSRNGEGWGPGRIDNITPAGVRSANRLGNSASPGQSAVFSGTGLGGARPEVWVGGHRAAIVSVRAGQAGKPDEILFTLPADSATGCFVPVQVRLPGAAPSNAVTMAIHTGGGRCESPKVLPMASWPGRTAGLIVLTRTVLLGAEGKPESTKDEAAAMFVARANEDDMPGPMLLIPPAGTCNTYSRGLDKQPSSPGSAADLLFGSVPYAGLDAGPRIGIARGNLVRRATPSPGAPGFYRALLGDDRGAPAARRPLFLEPGPLAIAGEGGAAVGRFQVVVPSPQALNWTNRASIESIDRARGVKLEWQPLAADSLVLISVVSEDSVNGTWGACYCAAPGSAGTFTIAPEFLANLPATHSQFEVLPPSLFLVALDAAHQQAFQAAGLEHALAASVYVQSLAAPVK